jgi:hypothetical protein
LSQAAADVARDAGLAVVFPRGAEASADHDIHGGGTVAFTQEDFTGGQPFPADGGEKFFPPTGFEAAEFLVENFAQEGGVGFWQARADIHLERF